jgi:hypothetical protein
MRTFVRVIAAAAAAAILAVPSAVFAQNENAAPYNVLDIAPGFVPDPHVLRFRAGGDLSAMGVALTCAGYITDAPTVQFNYTATVLPLIVSVTSDVDTTLAIISPDGAIHCADDDGINSVNPSIRFEHPVTGRYTIWVGTKMPGAQAWARLYVSERGAR